MIIISEAGLSPSCSRTVEWPWKCFAEKISGVEWIFACNTTLLLLLLLKMIIMMGINQSINQAINKSINQSINQWWGLMECNTISLEQSNGSCPYELVPWLGATIKHPQFVPTKVEVSGKCNHLCILGNPQPLPVRVFPSARQARISLRYLEEPGSQR